MTYNVFSGTLNPTHFTSREYPSFSGRPFSVAPNDYDIYDRP